MAVSARQLELVVDPTLCDGAGVCAELLPEHIRLDDWGFPVITVPAVSATTQRAAERACRACPKLALHLRPPC
jgi:ferredoxin